MANRVITDTGYWYKYRESFSKVNMSEAHHGLCPEPVRPVTFFYFATAFLFDDGMTDFVKG